jgi:hypothetical protein
MILCHHHRMRTHLLIAFVLCAGLSLPALADPVEIVGAAARQDGDTWSFDVTLRHPDTGWDHYADAWEVLAPDGTSLGLRALAHPHVEEQPFTRGLSGVAIPGGMDHVMIRARCLVDGWGDALLRVDLAR